MVRRIRQSVGNISRALALQEPRRVRVFVYILLVTNHTVPTVYDTPPSDSRNPPKVPTKLGPQKLKMVNWPFGAIGGPDRFCKHHKWTGHAQKLLF